MANTYFKFKQFTIHHDRCAMKVTTDSCLFGAWVSKEIEEDKNRIKNVLDIGCGTGLLSLMITQKNNVQIDAVEIDSGAAQQATENVEFSTLREKIKVVNSDILNYSPANHYDSIVSNPPFYESDLKSGKGPKNLAHHDEGLTLHQLFVYIQQHLTNNGFFFLLLPVKREKDIEALCKQFSFFIHKKIVVKQSIHHAPFRVMIKGGQSVTTEVLMEEISIKNEHNEYTQNFISLLKDYYLYL